MLKFDNLIKTILESPDAIITVDENGNERDVHYNAPNQRITSFMLFPNFQDKYLIFKDNPPYSVGHDHMIEALKGREWDRFITNFSPEELEKFSVSRPASMQGRIFRNQKIVSFWKNYYPWMRAPMNSIFKRIGVLKPDNYIFEFAGTTYWKGMRDETNNKFVYTYPEFMKGEIKEYDDDVE